MIRRKDFSEFLRIKNVQSCSAWKENAGNLRIKREHRSERGGSSLVMCHARGGEGKDFSGKVSIVPQWAKSEYAILGFRTHRNSAPEASDGSEGRMRFGLTDSCVWQRFAASQQ